MARRCLTGQPAGFHDQGCLHSRARTPEDFMRTRRKEDPKVENVERRPRTRDRISAARNQVALQKQKPKEATRMLRWKHLNVKADSISGSRP